MSGREGRIEGGYASECNVTISLNQLISMDFISFFSILMNFQKILLGGFRLYT